MKEKPLVSKTEIESLKGQGYQVVDLNDNPHGLKVRGPQWKVIAPDGSVVGHEWIAADAWVTAREHANTSPTLPQPG